MSDNLGGDPDADLVFRNRFDVSERPPSMAAIEAVTAVEDVDAMDLDRPLFDSIDPDALDAIIEAAGTDVAIEFTVATYDVVVHGVGEVRVYDHHE